MTPFFSGKNRIFSQLKKIRTSPVRNSRDDLPDDEKLGKRAALSASLWKDLDQSTRRFHPSASLSVEAALVLPLCIFSCALLMMPMKLFEEQRKIQGALEQTSRELSQYAYIAQQLEKGNEAIDGDGSLTSLISLAYVRTQVMSRIEERRVERVSFAESRILEDDWKILLVMNYRLKLPFSVFGLDSIPMQSVSLRRAWVGAEGGGLENSGGQQEAEDDQVVYLGKSATRYHISPTCHYLYNDLQAVAVSQVEGMRNAQGERYKPCARCGSASAQTVYVMPSGNRYHTSESCSAIIAYVRAVKKSEVEYLGACSYCGGG